MTATTSSDQQQFISRMRFHTRRSALDPYPSDLAERDTPAERLDDFVFGLFCDLVGDGGLDPHRLSPKGRPDVDVVITSMHSAWNNPDYFEPEDEAEREADKLFTAVRAKLGERLATVDQSDLLTVMTVFAGDVFQIIEDGYELVRQEFDEDGEYLPGQDGPDIAPGLVAAYQAAMSNA